MAVLVTEGSLSGFRALSSRNDYLRATLIPELGGRIWELEDSVRGRQWIWHRPGVPLRQSEIGASYDDVWAGGWEELFPNDAAGTFEGRELADHGEWWTSDWQVRDRSDGSSALIERSTSLSIVGATCTKILRAPQDDASSSIRYAIRSDEPEPFHFLFKQHLPISISPRCRIVLPGGRARPVNTAFSAMIAEESEFDWPVAGGFGGPIDMSTIPAPSEAGREFLYVRDLPESWFRIDDEDAQASLQTNFEPDKLPYVWLFMTYGGWRDLYTVVLDPCSNRPKDLSAAVREGRSAFLRPGEEFATEVTVSLWPLMEEIV